MTPGSAVCPSKPLLRIATHGVGAEDMVALPLAEGRVRLFLREVCHGRGCTPDRFRVGCVDIGPETAPVRTDCAWRPPTAEPFKPLGMSLLAEGPVGVGTLYLLDTVQPPRIWRLEIVAGEITEAEVVREWQGDVLRHGNNLQAVGETLYVTRFDPLGWWPWRRERWHGVVALRKNAPPRLFELGLRGANGIVDLGPGRELLVANYWGRDLRFVAKDGAVSGESAIASARLPIYPDNLSRDGERILIAGQRYPLLAALNLLLPWVPSPSAVYAIDIQRLGPAAEPELLWQGGWRYGRSVSVAVSMPGGLALGQIRAADVLLLQCETSVKAGT